MSEKVRNQEPDCEGGSPGVAGGTVDRENERLRALFDEAPDGVVVHDEQGRVIRTNDTLAEMLGYSREELQSMTVTDFEIGIDEELLREKWAAVTPGGTEKVEVGGVHRRRDGSTYPVEAWVSRIDSDMPELAAEASHDAEHYYVAHVRDVSERRDRERQLETQRDDLEMLNQVVRHDIRNDLQLVQAYSELLEDHVDEAGKEYLETVRESTENAVSLTTTARELADVMLRPETETAEVPLRGTLEGQIGEIRSSHTEAVVTVEGRLPETTVTADGMLDSVFRNLLKNAIQHNDKEVPDVAVSADRRDDAVRVRVADNGPGVPENQRDEIFGRGEKGLESSGTGLGLYLVRSLVDGYGGDVWVEDNDPEGAVFLVELPVAG